jgi:hypothetical protein
MQALTPELQKLLSQLSQHLQSEPEKNPPLLEIWDVWVANLDLSRQTLSDQLRKPPIANCPRFTSGF